MKKVVAVSPYIYPTSSNFKYKTFKNWEVCGGTSLMVNYPSRIFHHLLFNHDLIPTLIQRGTSRLCFVQPYSLYFDTCHSALSHEIIPFIWDCWPEYDDKLISWIKAHNIHTCIFTSSEAKERISIKLPYLETFMVTEGINTELYTQGKELIDRTHNLYMFGRRFEELYNTEFDGLDVVQDGTNEEFFNRLKDSQVTIAVPRCDVELEKKQETLTQRYWECMLSRMVMVGRSPKELVELIGYDPVIPIERTHLVEQLKDICKHINEYQSLVDRNRKIALRMAPWEIRMKQVMAWLVSLGYKV